MTPLRHHCAHMDNDGVSAGLIHSRRRAELFGNDVPTNLVDSTPPSHHGDTHPPGLACAAILLIEPNHEIRGLIRFGLEKQGHRIVEAASGRRGLELARQLKPRAILLDLNLADCDGVALLKRLRERSPVPILTFSDRIHEEEAITALDCGANDYLQRPFSMAVLSARLRASLRFVPPPAPEIFCSGSLRVDLANRTVHVADRRVSLSATEYSLLQLFIRHAGQVLAYSQILREIWGTEDLERMNDLRVYLLFLRKKLANPAEPDLFRTERAVGYGLVLR